MQELFAEKGANILDISQTILEEYFAMIMIIDLSDTKEELATLARESAEYGKSIDMSVYLQHEDIFDAMHTI